MISRNLTPLLEEALRDRPVVFLHGARQAGKSTLAQMLPAEEWNARYLTLDDLATLSAAVSDPAGFIAGLSGPVILDEVQRAPVLFRAIKASVDRDRRPGRFLLTGSARILVLPELADALTGRMEIHTLWPLSQGESEGVREGFIDAAFRARPLQAVEGTKGWSDLVARLIMGGYPEVQGLASARRRNAWFASYISTILQREVRDLANIEGLSQIPRILSLLSARITSLLNFAEISRSIAIPQTTLKRYFELLQGTFLIQTVPAWSSNLGKRLTKSPKLFLSDTGLISYLLGLDEGRLRSESTLAGHLLENFVIMELIKQSAWSETQPRIFHFRTQSGQEVDAVLENRAGGLVGIEVKASATVTADHFKGLHVLAETTGTRFKRGIVLYTGRETVPFGKNLYALPVSALWQLRTSA